MVTADLDTFEPLAARLRQCDGDTGPQRALLPFGGGSAPPLRLSRPAGEKADNRFTVFRFSSLQALLYVCRTVEAGGSKSVTLPIEACADNVLVMPIEERELGAGELN